MTGLAPAILDAAAIGGVGGIAWGLRMLFKLLRAVKQMAGDWHGAPARPGFDRTPGVMERLQSQDAVLAEMRHEVKAISDELPKNGVPLAHKIDALWSKHLRDQETSR